MTQEQIEDMGMTLALMEADLLFTKNALEEVQQQLLNKQIESNEWEDQYMELNQMHHEQQSEAGETLDLLKETSRSLVEAQETIAWQRKVMKEADIVLNAAQLLALFIGTDGKPMDGFRFRELVVNLVVLLKLVDWAALGGNKEGGEKET